LDGFRVYAAGAAAVGLAINCAEPSRLLTRYFGQRRVGADNTGAARLLYFFFDISFVSGCPCER